MVAGKCAGARGAHPRRASHRGGERSSGGQVLRRLKHNCDGSAGNRGCGGEGEREGAGGSFQAWNLVGRFAEHGGLQVADSAGGSGSYERRAARRFVHQVPKAVVGGGRIGASSSPRQGPTAPGKRH